MSKSTGIGSRFFLGGYDVSGDVGALQGANLTRTVLDVTGLDKSAMERIGGLADGEISYNGFWNVADDALHEAASSLPSTDRHAMYCHGVTVGAAAAALVGKQINFNATRGQDGSLVTAAQAQASAGVPLEWGVLLTTGKQTFASAANGASIDNGGASASGAAAYLQVFSVGSGTVEVDVQDSADDAAFAAITGLEFTGASARAVERLEVSGAVRQYVRVAVAGTFTNAVIAVAFKRY